MKNPWKKLLANIKISGRIWSQTNRHPQKLIELTPEDLESKFNEQDGKCYWLGIPLNPQDIFEPFNQLAISVDRIDNAKHYTFDNIVICCRFVNLGKGQVNSDKFAYTINKIKQAIMSS